jgi:glyoxylase-like metal-dependent hydrolase (beta-lactamase superfamily II)
MELLDGIYLVGSGETGVSDRYDCHVYLLDCGDAALVIDSGAGRDPARVFSNIRRRMPLEKAGTVLLTHTHADHSGGTPAFQAQGMRVLAPEKEMEAMRARPEEVLEAFRLAKNDGSYPPDYEYPFITPDGVVRDGDTVCVGDTAVSAMHFGGHSEGHLCYLIERRGKRILFSGDFVFAGGHIGLLNCPGSDLASYRRDIGKLSGLGIDVLLPGHRIMVLDGGQRHLDMAVDALSKATVPATF